jgi:hypothetical protein
MKRRPVLLPPAVLLVSAVAFVYLAGVVRQHKPEPDGLHRDEDIRRLASYDIDAETKSARTILDMPWLEVVPAGSDRPRGEIFRALGIDDSRIRDFRTNPSGKVVFLRWQVSPSYDVVCMTSAFDWNPEAVPLPFADPQRAVYGIRLVSRGEGADPLLW